MRRIVLGGFLSVFAMCLGAVASFAQTVQFSQAVEFSQGAYYVHACPGHAFAGFANCHALIVTDRSGRVVERKSPAPQITGYTPTNLRSAYNVTSAGSTATLVAIVDAFGYNNAEADLGTYRAQFGLPACTTANHCFAKYNQRGSKTGYPQQNLGWAQETALDLDMVSAMCPNCHIALVEANSSSNSDLATAENVAASLGAHAISNSYGGPEAGSQSSEPSYNHPGIAITVSTGDAGFSAGPQFPATSPHVIAVGGTSLYMASNARGWSETAWADAGSGCSTIYGKPVWQTDPLCTMRMEADVSAVANPATGVAVYGPVTLSASTWLQFGGTSVAAPLVAGIYGANGGPVSYGSNPYSASGALNDVTSGSNGSCGGTYFCTAGPGYDGPTGLGTPKGTSAF